MSFTSAPPASRWSDVYLAAGARAVSYCGDFVAATALVLALQSRGASGYAIAAILLAAAVPPVVLAPLTGRLADRLDSRTLLVTTGAIQAVICVGLAYTTSVVGIVALATALACGLAVTQPTLAALTPSMVTRADLPKAAAMGQSATALGQVLAPVLGGLLVGAYGLRVPLLLDAGSYLALVVAGFVIRTRRGGSHAGAADAAGQAGIAPAPRWRLRADGLIWPLVVLIGAVVGVISMFEVAEVFLVRGPLHASTTMYGVVNGGYAAAMVIGALWMGRRALTDSTLATSMITMIAAICAVVAVAATLPNAYWLIGVYAIGGAINGALNVNAGVLLGRRVPPEVRGQAFANFNAVVNGAAGLGLLAGGVLASTFSPRPLVGVVGIAGIAVTLLFTPPLIAAATRERAASTRQPAPATA